MNALEQVALGLHCTTRALGEALRPSRFALAALPLAGQLLALFAIVFGTHPALSWVMAPLLTAAAGEAALRYPQLFHRLPQLATAAQFWVGVLLVPPAAAAATRVLDERFHGRQVAAGAALAAALRRTPALVLALLPAAAATWGLDALLAAATGVRLSGLSRAALPGAIGFLQLAVRAAFAWVIAEMVLDERGPLRALAALPHAFGRGFVAALTILAVMQLPLAPFGVLEGLAAGGGWAGHPELTLLFALAHALVQAAVMLVTAGAIALAWRGAVAPAAEGA